MENHWSMTVHWSGVRVTCVSSQLQYESNMTSSWGDNGRKPSVTGQHTEAHTSELYESFRHRQVTSLRIVILFQCLTCNRGKATKSYNHRVWSFLCYFKILHYLSAEYEDIMGILWLSFFDASDMRVSMGFYVPHVHTHTDTIMWGW